MPKKKPRKKSNAQLQKEIVRLKKLNKEAAERKALFSARAKEVEEIRELRREARELSGVGSKRRVAGQVGKKIGRDVGKVGWKGLKMVGKFTKNVVEAQAREQARERDRARPKSKPKKKK